jgi:hypothetical protein
MDPPEPGPGSGGHAHYEELPAEAIDAFVAAAGPGSGSPRGSAELRHTTGALARSGPDHGALAALDGALCFFAVGMAPVPPAAEAIQAQVAKIKSELRQYEAGSTFLNFTEQPADVSGAFPDDSYRRLQRVRAEFDPDELFRANHQIAPA